MIKILKYEEYSNDSFLNEASMDETYGKDPKKSLLLFSDTIRNDFNRKGGKFDIFYEFYDPQYDNNFFGLRLIEYNPAFRTNYKDIRFTYLTSGSFKDTDSKGRKKLYYDPTPDKESVRGLLVSFRQYYFYEVVQGDRNRDRAPNREDEMHVWNSNERRWIFLIKKNKNCGLVKSKSRQEGGAWLEHLINRAYGWNIQPHDIKLIYKIDNIALQTRSIVKQIFQSSDESIFSIENTDNVASSFVKYDFVVDNEFKLEVKKLKSKEKELWDNNKSQRFQIAETLKIADRRQLKNLVKWYNDIYSHDQRSWQYKASLALSRLSEREIASEFSLDEEDYDDDDGIPVRTFEDICDEIRHHYNTQTVRLLKVLNQIPKNRWMAGIHGIYFGGQDRFDRRWDFIIKLDEGIRYQWKFVREWLGFRRLKLFIYVSGDAWEYLIADGNRFIKAFQLKDWEQHKEDKAAGLITVDDGSTYRYNNETKFWEEVED
jgi:hypothetical protein